MIDPAHILADAGDVLDLLFSLVEKSLVVVSSQTDSTRYRFLEPTRAFAAEQLQASSERETLARRHAQWVAEFAERAMPFGTSFYTLEGVTAQMQEFDNARAALEWSIGRHGDVTIGARIVGAMRGCWELNGLLTECRRCCETVLARLDSQADPAIVSRAFRALIRSMSGENEIELIERALPFFERAQDWNGFLVLTSRLAYRLSQKRRVNEALHALDRAQEIHERRNLGRSPDWATSLMHHSNVYRRLGRLSEAKDAIDESLATARAVGAPLPEMWSLIAAGEIAFTAGDLARAIALANDCLVLLAMYPHAFLEIHIRNNLAAYNLARGDVPSASMHARWVVAQRQKAGAIKVVWSILHLAAVAAIDGDWRRAAQLKGYVDAYSKRREIEAGKTEEKIYDVLARALQGRGGSADEIAQLEREGAHLSDAAAAELASAETIT